MKCKNCGLHRYRENIVKGKGDKPAQLLFIGEAPGLSEDTIGLPFIGASGKLLDVMINDAFIKSKLKRIPTYYITNTVMCRPTDRIGGKNRQPTEEEVLSCRENVLKIILEVNADATILVGKFAEKYYGGLFSLYYTIQHPAYLVRGGGIIHPEYNRNIRILTNIFKEL